MRIAAYISCLIKNAQLFCSGVGVGIVDVVGGGVGLVGGSDGSVRV